MFKLYFFKTNLTLGQYPLMLSSGCLWPSIVWSAGRDELLSFLINQSTISYRDPVKALFWNFHAIFTMRVFELGSCIIILCLKHRKQNREATQSRSVLNRLITGERTIWLKLQKGTACGCIMSISSCYGSYNKSIYFDDLLARQLPN